MIHAVDDPLTRILAVPLDAPLLVVTGAVASGKSEALARRYAVLLPAAGGDPATTLVASTHAAGASDLATRIAERLDPAMRAAFAAAPFTGTTLDTLAFAIVAEGALAGGLAPDLERLAPYETEEVFARAAAPLFSAEWADYLGADIDPEISGLRTPARFAAAVLRSIVKLRDAGIGPAEMLHQALRGATSFYGKLPNLSEPGLLYATKDEYRGSLMVDAEELERQRRREIDLAKIVAKLYESYIAELVRHGCLGTGDAVAEATRMLAESPPLGASFRRRLTFAVIDDAHDLRTGEIRLLQLLFGADLTRVTAAGAAQSAVQTFAGARPDALFKLAKTTIALPGTRVPAAIVEAARAILRAEALTEPPGGALRVVHAAERELEVRAVADAVAATIASGTPPGRIAVVHRSARCLMPYEEALLERNVPVALHGDVDVLGRADTADALAVLWAATDPFAHDWLLRALQLPAVGLSDATLALLCGEPANPQAMLFALPADDAPGDRRWDRRRDIRLACNVIRGERDGDLDAGARARVRAFRERCAAWAAMARDGGIGAARAIVADAGLLEPRADETPARHRRRIALIEALMRLLDRHAARFPGAPLDDALGFLARVAAAERGPQLDDDDPDAVFVGAVDRIGPRRFAQVFVVDVRAGSFPPYYVPDAFLFSPRYGMIPKDAAGDAPAARTAKFTWYVHHAKLREMYAAEHRRLLALAISRADETATISAGGRLTRGVAAPEFINELRGAR
jgi:superfamily I DNA/RNA helicase